MSANVFVQRKESQGLNAYRKYSKKKITFVAACDKKRIEFYIFSDNVARTWKNQSS